MAEKTNTTEQLIKNPDTESAYQIVVGQVPVRPAEVAAPVEATSLNPEVAAFVAGKQNNQTPGANPFADRAVTQQAIGQQATMDNTGGTSPEVAEMVAGKGAAVPPTTPITGQEQQVTTPAADNKPAATTPTSEQPIADTNGAGTGETANGVRTEDYTFTGKQLEQMGPSVEDEPGKPQYLTDWSKVGNVYEEAKKINLPLAQVLQDYQRWGNETGNPTYWINAMFQDADLSKTAAENEAEKKRIANKERWDKVSNFLLHLGNAIGNVGGKGYASMKLEDPVHWSERQRQLKEKALEQRRLNNQSIYQQMLQGWADQRNYNLQQQRLENEKLKAGLQEELAKARKALDEKREQQIQAKIDELNAMLPLKQDTERSKAQKNRQQGNAATTRAARAGQPKPVQAKVVEKEKTDYRGRKSTEKTTTYPAGSKKNDNKQQSTTKKPTGVKWVQKPKK